MEEAQKKDESHLFKYLHNLSKYDHKILSALNVQEGHQRRMEELLVGLTQVCDTVTLYVDGFFTQNIFSSASMSPNLAQSGKLLLRRKRSSGRPWRPCKDIPNLVMAAIYRLLLCGTSTALRSPLQRSTASAPGLLVAFIAENGMAECVPLSGCQGKRY